MEEILASYLMSVQIWSISKVKVSDIFYVFWQIFFTKVASKNFFTGKIS